MTLTDPKLYALLVTHSTQDNSKLLQQFPKCYIPNVENILAKI